MVSSVQRAQDLWLTISGKYSRIGGKVFWNEGDTAPRFAEFVAEWPVVRIRLVASRRLSRPQTSIQVRAQSWHAHFPGKRLGVPAAFRISADTSRERVYSVGAEHVFDLTGLTPLPTDDLERRAIILLQEIETLRHTRPDIFDKLGIEINVKFRDDE